MIPIKLTLEGLYSYQERQTIDFEALTDAGLFGIFGNVGSGKSSILEAITFALYGNSDRLGSTNFAYNMMNLKSNKLFIEFEFMNAENKLYKITREYKRNGKNFDKIVNAGVVLYKFENDWVPQESSDVEPILGLSSENFRRTIIIPQGQFKEFIELKPTARTQMMKDIFGLHRYDLQDKVAGLNSKNSVALNQLEGKLSGFEEVSEENIKQLEELLVEQVHQVNQIQHDFTSVNENFQRLKALKVEVENLKLKKLDFEKLSDQKVEIDQRKIDLERYEKIYNSFFQLILNQTKVEKEIATKSDDLKIQKKQFLLLENELKEVSNQLEKTKIEHDNLANKRQESSDLEFILQILQHSLEIEKLKERTANGVKKVEEVELNEQKINEQIKAAEFEIKHLNQSKIDAQLLMDVGNWFNQNQIIEKSIQNQNSKISDIQKQLLELKNQLKEQEIEVNTFDESFKLKFEELENSKKAKEKIRTELEVQQKLAHYAHNLHDGEACPLCGALEHPKIVESDDVSIKISAIENELNEIVSQTKLLQKKQNECQKLIDQIQFLEKQFKLETSQVEELSQQLKNHFELFKWSDFDSTNFEDFEKKKNLAISVEKSITEQTKLVNEEREKLELERVHLEKYKKALEQFKLEEAEKSTQIKQNKSNLKVLNFADFENQTVENIQQKSNELRLFIQKTEQLFNQFTEQFNQLSTKITAQKTSIQLTEKQVVELNNEVNQIKLEINSALKKTEIESLEEVHIILKYDLDIAKIRKEIEDFRVQYETLKLSIEELEIKLKDVSFDENAYQEQEDKLKFVTLQLKEINEVATKTKTEIERLTKSFAEKKDLLVELEQLQKRATNLQTMRNLFNSAGFVQYVSSIYLKQLCDNANVRFHRMTRNQLSLQMNEANEFEIIDYLNEGKSRSVRTLSGGQAFQVSLSLALALAESVQTNAKSEKNFFFIDEGFGTQDTEAVNIVFETLMSLQKENRIVGIISHVDELKERIPIALNITKDEEKGSRIEMV